MENFDDKFNLWWKIASEVEEEDVVRILSLFWFRWVGGWFFPVPQQQMCNKVRVNVISENFGRPGRKGGNREKEKRTPILLFPYFHALLSVLGAPLSTLRGFNGYWARKRGKEKVPQVNNNVEGKV